MEVGNNSRQSQWLKNVILCFLLASSYPAGIRVAFAQNYGGLAEIPDGVVITDPEVRPLEGSRVLLKCQFRGRPIAVYWRKGDTVSSAETVVQWYNGVKSGSGLDDGSFNMDDNYSLIINNVRFTDGGRYFCRVSNDQGLLIHSYTDVTVINVRLVDGSNSYEGRVEIYYLGEWGTICDDGFGFTDANVVCRQLGYPFGASNVHNSAFFGYAYGRIWLDEVSCSGTESSLTSCGSNGWGVNDCSHGEDVGITCFTTSPDLRLVGGSGNYEGRVEIYYSGEWGTICDDGFELTDANVVCRQLGYPFGASNVHDRAFFGRGSGRIWLDDVSCNGTESFLSLCDSGGWGIHNCYHGEDVGITCVPTSRNLRLVGGSDNYEGRVEIYYSGEWGTICDDDFELTDANVVCRQLGYPLGASNVHDRAFFGRGSGRIWLDDVDCLGTETSLSACSHRGWGIHNCIHSEDVGVRCNQTYSVRLVGGSSIYEGRVEIHYEGQWGTVCDDGFGLTDGDVVCQQLGFTRGAARVRSSAYFGQGSGPIWLADVFCFGSDTQLIDCSHSGWGNHNCGHYEDAGVECLPNEISTPPTTALTTVPYFSVRLVDGSNDYEGRVEVNLGYGWTTICDDGWDINDANVVCRQLGYSGADRAPDRAYFGPGTGTISLTSVQCSGTESQLKYCPYTFHSSSCSHLEDASVVCSHNDPEPDTLSVAAIVGIVVGVTFLIVILIVILVCCCVQSKATVRRAPQATPRQAVGTTPNMQVFTVGNQAVQMVPQQPYVVPQGQIAGNQYPGGVVHAQYNNPPVYYAYPPAGQVVCPPNMQTNQAQQQQPQQQPPPPSYASAIYLQQTQSNGGTPDGAYANPTFDSDVKNITPVVT